MKDRNMKIDEDEAMNAYVEELLTISLPHESSSSPMHLSKFSYAQTHLLI